MAIFAAFFALGTHAWSAELGSDSVPATPLVACDPYFSVWSTGKKLTDANTSHWTGKPHRLTSLASIDGKTYRLMGADPANVEAMPQVSSAITPTQTKYRFCADGVDVELKFTTPALPDDVDVLSRPITYVTYRFESQDGRSHDVRIYFEASAELTVNVAEQRVVAEIVNPTGLTALEVGSLDQPVLEAKGDDLRIDWGYLYLASTTAPSSQFAAAAPGDLQGRFMRGKPLVGAKQSDAARADHLSSAIAMECKVEKGSPASRWLILAYDDLESIEYMGSPLKAYWRRNGLDAEGLLVEAARDRESLIARCDQFDNELLDDLLAAGGEDYAMTGALAYRQCFAAGKFVADASGQPLQFCKENHSNGCIATSDVFYPMAPQFLLFGSSLAKSFVVPFMEYAASDRWKFPFAPHDLGTYPKANGQVYGGGERTEENQMPVEESGNLLILMAAIAKIDGNADFAERYWPQLEKWAGYLKKEGFDPANQLCTDDFAGHLAHNVNLSAKAIGGLGAFSQLCDLKGDHKLAAEYRKTAEDFAARWIKDADDGDHYRLAFDKPGSWSQKYNLVWDRILGLNLFPDEVFEKEMAYYRRIQNRYGMPLDNRKEYTKLDWILWTATLTGDREDFAALIGPVRKFLRETPDRSPMTDWYETVSGKKVGFTARPVVGGVFIKLLHDDAVWQKWASRDQTKSHDFAPMPTPPKMYVDVAAADTEPATWRYATEQPGTGWHEPGFDDSSWQTGKSGFGTPQTPGARVGTLWDAQDIWLRRTFDLPAEIGDSLRLNVHHDEDAEIYINGVLARRIGGFTGDYELLKMTPAAIRALRPTGNVMAVHCRQTMGGQYIDVGVATVEDAPR